MHISKNLPFYSFKNYYLNKYGYQIFRLPVDSHISCPNIDGSKGTGGCIYCDGADAAVTINRSNLSIEEQINTKINYFENKKCILYFQTNTFTYRDISNIKKIIKKSLNMYDFKGFTISTRPDCLNAEIIKMIADYQNHYPEIWIELGLQSIHDNTLEKINRCHTFKDFMNSFKLLRNANIKTAVHMITGLPGENEKMILDSYKKIGQISCDGIKFHNIMVLKNTKLEIMYKNDSFEVISREKYIELTAKALCFLSPETVIMRLSSDAPPESLVTPDWCLDKNKLRSDLISYMNKNFLTQGMWYPK